MGLEELGDLGGLYNLNIDFTPIIITVVLSILFFTVVMTIVNYFIKIRIVKIGTLQALKEFYSVKDEKENNKQIEVDTNKEKEEVL